MRNILFLGLTLILFTAFGCATPEPVVEQVEVEKPVIREVQPANPAETMSPITPAILQRLRDSGEELTIDERIKKYQFRLVGRISLEREFTETNDGLAEDGAARFENKHIKENIVIGDQTDGQVIALRILLNENNLHICFENDDKYELVFVARKDDPDGFFYLSYNPIEGPGGERGTLFYGDELYKVKFGDRVPYILIKLAQKDVDFVNSRTVTGRRINRD